MTTDTRKDSRVRCLWGGYAPCIDDLCRGVDTTMCGLEYGFDVCDHGSEPEFCPEYPCNADREPWDDDDDQARA